MASVSVVVPVYNHERFVAAALESALAQTEPPREIVCIDDGSTDGSARAVRDLAARHPIIRFTSRPNRGAAATLNEAIALCTGELVAVLNSDDIFHPTRLARASAAFSAEQSAAAVCSAVEFIDGNGKVLQNRWYEDALATHRLLGDLGLGLVNANFLVSTSNLVVRRAAFEALGGFDDLRYAHDLDFFLRLLARGERIVTLPQALLGYRMHGKNTIAESVRDSRLECAVVSAFFAHRLARKSPPASDEYLVKLFGVLERQGLSRAAALALVRAGQGRAHVSECMKDPAFVAAIRATLPG